MKKETVVRMRDAYDALPNRIGLEVVCDNMIFYVDGKDILHWDDANETLTVLKVTERYDHDVNQEFELQTVEYDTIQYMNFNCGRKAVEAVCNTLAFTEKELEAVKAFVNKATTIKL